MSGAVHPFIVKIVLNLLLGLASVWALVRSMHARPEDDPIKSDSPFVKEHQHLSSNDHIWGRDRTAFRSQAPLSDIGPEVGEVEIFTAPARLDAMRDFYVDLLGLLPMRAPDRNETDDGFWLASGMRRVFVRAVPGFSAQPDRAVTLIHPQLDQVAKALAAAGCGAHWDGSLAYVRRLGATDPAGNPLILAGA